MHLFQSFFLRLKYVGIRIVFTLEENDSWKPLRSRSTPNLSKLVKFINRSKLNSKFCEIIEDTLRNIQ